MTRTHTDGPLTSREGKIHTSVKMACNCYVHKMNSKQASLHCKPVKTMLTE